MAGLRHAGARCNLLGTPACPVDARLHELQANQERLEAQNAALLRAHAALEVSQDALRKSEASAHLILRAMPFAMLVMGRHGCITQANTLAEAMFGYPRGGMDGLTIEDLIPERFRAAHRDYRGDSEHPARHRIMGMAGGDYYGLRGDGGEFPVEIGLSPLQLGDERLVVVSVNDITERKKAEEDLRITAIAFESQAGMIVTNADGVIVRVNQAFTRLTGYSADEAIGKTTTLLHSGRHDSGFYQLMWSTIKDKGFWQGEIWNRRRDGKIHAEWLTITAVAKPDGEISHYVGTYSDITQNSEAEAEIHRLAYYDPLTQLPNRRLLYDRLAQALASSSRNHHHGAVLFLDLDNFKTLNDTRGHAMGDQLLTEVACRLQITLRECDTVSRMNDTVSRLGGDEFVLLLEDLSECADEAAIQARQVGEKLRDALALPYDLANSEFHCTASFGVTLFHGHDDSIESLLKQADLALYQAKNAGRNTLRFFNPAMQAAMDERGALEADLRRALKRCQLYLHYQPQIDSKRRIIGAEALLRWEHPERGMISPDIFIPLAEETGLILSIGRWVMQTACAQIKAWSGNPATRDLRLAVNVSARQFRQPGFVADMKAMLDDYDIDPTRLKIELTESLVIDNVADSIIRMQALQAIGISFSMDDFGTGFSSLSYLKRLPLDQLKIDRSFVRDLAHDPNDAAIVQTIITMGRTLGLDVIAEGVENEAQLERLDQYGCIAYQGYLFSRPVPLQAFERLLDAA